jgi:hypothetical protein
MLFHGVNFAQAPTLGTTANFVLFSSSGAVGNTGITHLTGNVGTNSGSNTGFGNVNGVMHSSDGVTGQCASDLLIAYNQLNTADPNFSHAPLLGNGDTLVAGVYAITGVTTLSGDLFLDARGDSSAVFIFQVSAPFSANVDAKVKLIHGAQACNVFWKIEGLFSLASGVSMKGTVIVNNAAISMNTNDTLEGRVLTTTGAVSVSGILAYTPVGCGSPLLTGPASPNLLSTACFAVFSSSGPVSNAGTTIVTGDVGTNSGLTTGFDPLTVHGMIHPVPDGATTQAASDLLNVYNQLNTLPYDIELLYPPQFGSNLVLTPHTYIMNGAATFTDSLFLNAEGDSNAVFVIQIKGALSTSTFSKVILINGAAAKNVYWVVDGAVSISDFSVFNGSIICNNGAIALSTGVSISGRAMTTTGAVSTSSDSVHIASACEELLPITWIYFRGSLSGSSVLLSWATASEVSNALFTIEKSSDGMHFTTLTTVKAAASNGASQNQYSTTDPQPFNVNFYRISQTDKDGRKSFYKVIQVNGSAQFKAFAYVQDKHAFVQASGAAPGNGMLELYSIDGKKISSQNIVLTKETSLYAIDKTLMKGMYFIHIESNGEKLYNAKIVVQ